MATGKDLVEVMVAVATLNTGKGFTFFTNIDRWPEERGPLSEQALNELALHHVELRMAPINETFRQLVESCKQTGTIWHHPKRNWAVRTLDRLRPEQEQLLVRIKQQLDDRYHHLLATAEVYGLTPEDVEAQARFAIWVVELPAEVFDPEGPRHDSYTWQQGWAYKQLRHVVEWATRALHAEGQRQIAARPVRSELSIQAEWRDGAQTSLAGVTAPIGSVIASQWHQPSEKPRELTEDEAVRFMACPACSL